jgi:hypothetical protein
MRELGMNLEGRVLTSSSKPVLARPYAWLGLGWPA